MSKLIACVIVLLLPIDNAICKRMWDYTLLSMETTSSDPSKLRIDSAIDRINRTASGISATIHWNYDVDETTFVHLIGHRSNTGNEDDYVLLPWTIPNQTIAEFSNSYYKPIIHKNMEHCSTLPEKVYPISKGTVWKFERCVIKGENLPHYLPDGMYKASFYGIGEVDFSLTVVIKVFKKIDLFG
ncbi:uncharacterized protein LOC108594910 [Drosophila busckii]|uniref:uncharacterized protein LOC108594910 n=1 Tax=Drosophila busckii TaxID=30019 RepID=UPI00083F2C2F|nr:uncharacterized protein LOC108594910 [Drosophila busckii]